MKSYLRALPALALGMAGMSLPGYAQTPAAPVQSPGATVTKIFVFKYLFPSQTVNMLKGIGTGNDPLNTSNTSPRKPLEGIAEMTPNDSERSLSVRGSAERIKELESLFRFLDVKPRALKLELKVYEIQPAADGTTTEVLVGTPGLNSINNMEAGVSFVSSGTDKGMYLRKFAMTPHINGDNSVSVALTFASGAIRNPIGEKFDPQALPVAEVKLIRRIQQNEWISLGKVSLAEDKAIRDAVLSGVELTPAAYPLYRIEARVTETIE